MTPRRVRSPWTRAWSRPSGSTRVLLKVMVGIFLHVEKIGAFQVLVPLLHAGVDGGGVDFDRHCRGRNVERIKIEAARDSVELAPDPAYHHMTHRKER